ncbi:MAG: hypothetical protein HC779_01920 [Phyllobacteriaceae bacterium]|nr:hypothetical protein [Phyllobacteriaceae bacterium]
MAELSEIHDALPDTPQPAEATMLVGHQELLASLLADHAAHRMHHAIMLSGEPGIGKATLAFRFAQHVLADAGDMDSAAKIAANAHPSLMHVVRSRPDAAKAMRTVIAIDDIHRVSHFLAHTAGGNGPRIIIIDPVNDLNASSANALLKNLEEPPKNTYYFLIVHAGGKCCRQSDRAAGWCGCAIEHSGRCHGFAAYRLCGRGGDQFCRTLWRQCARGHCAGAFWR